MLIVYNLHLELVGISYGYLYFLGIYVFTCLLFYLLGYVPLVGSLVVIFTGVYFYFCIWCLIGLGIGIDIISGKSISVLSGGNDLHGLG